MEVQRTLESDFGGCRDADEVFKLYAAYYPDGIPPASAINYLRRLSVETFREVSKAKKQKTDHKSGR